MSCGIYIDLDDIRRQVKYLVEQNSLKISDLENKYPTVYSEFNSFVKVVSQTTNSDVYDEIFKIIEEETATMIYVTPGTIGAYFRGCLLPVSFPGNPSCSDLCANSFQPPDRIEGWSRCDQIVIQAKKLSTSKGYYFDLIRHGKNPGFLLVESTTLSEFQGFSKQELDILASMGLTNCKLLTISPKSGYRDLLGGFHSISSLPARISTEDSENGNFLWIVGLILIIIVIIGIFFLLKPSDD